jgi:hypothetical protein
VGEGPRKSGTSVVVKTKLEREEGLILLSKARIAFRSLYPSSAESMLLGILYISKGIAVDQDVLDSSGWRKAFPGWAGSWLDYVQAKKCHMDAVLRNDWT